MLQIVFNTTIPNIVLKSIEIKDGTKPLSGKFTVDTIAEAVTGFVGIEDVKQAKADAASAYPSADAIKLDYKAKIDLIVEAAIEAINSDEATTVARVDELRSLAVLRINGRKEEALTAIAKINEFEDAKVQAIANITNARQGIQNENLNRWIDGAIKDIQNGGPDATPGIDEIKNQILTVINFFKDGKAEGKTELLGAMGEECTDCTVVEVTDGTTTVKLYNPTKVSYIKQE